MAHLSMLASIISMAIVTSGEIIDADMLQDEVFFLDRAKRQAGEEAPPPLPTTEPEVEGSGGILACFHGRSPNFISKDCAESEQMCMTQLDYNNGQWVIVKMCKQPQACARHARDNSRHCQDINNNNGVAKCTSCCGDYLCNTAADLEELKEQHASLAALDL